MSSRNLGLALVAVVLVVAAVVLLRPEPPTAVDADGQTAEQTTVASEQKPASTSATETASAETPPAGAATTDQPEPSLDDSQAAADPPAAKEVNKKEKAPSKLRDKHAGEPPSRKPVFDGWEKPALALVLSGEMHGYVEPCGCSLHQLGGLSRRANLFQQIKDRGWPVTAFDTGGVVSNPSRAQAKIKLRMALESLRQMEYAGIALGVEELLLGFDLLTFAENERPPFLSCNLTLFGDPGLGPHVPKSILNVGGLKVGVTAVFGESLKPKVIRPGSDAAGQPQDIVILDPTESLRKTVAELEAERPDLLVLIAHAQRDETKELAAKFPQFDLIVSAGGPEDPDPRPQTIGKTLLVFPGQKGKNVAVVGLFPGNTEQRLRYELVALDEVRFKETESIRDQMRVYQETLTVHNLVANEPAIEDPRNAELSVANPFVGAQVCGECHTQAYKKWKETGHAKATQSIKTGRKGQEATYISRIHDPECVACHVTGWDPGRGDPKDYYRYKTGFESEAVSAHLLGQQCENCHGPGGRHSELERQFQQDQKETEELAKFRDLAQLLVDDVGAKLCVKCHDGDNDPHFKTDGDVFQEYWEEIKHPWRD